MSFVSIWLPSWVLKRSVATGRNKIENGVEYQISPSWKSFLMSESVSYVESDGLADNTL